MDVSILKAALPAGVGAVHDELDSKTYLLACGGDGRLASATIQATKALFDLGIALESLSHPHIHPLVAEILQPPTVTLRSAAVRGADRPKSSPTEIIPYTPLSVLTTDGMDLEQVWAQLELRAQGVSQVLREVGDGGMGVDEDEQEGEGEVERSDDESGSSEEMTAEEWKALMAEEGFSDSDEEGSSAEERSSDEDGDVKWKDEMGSDDEDEEEEEEEEEADEEAESLEEGEEDGSDEEPDPRSRVRPGRLLKRAVEDDNEDEQDDDSDDAAEQDGEEENEDEGDDDEDEADQEEEDDAEDLQDDGVEADDLGALFGSAAGPSRSRTQHPTLDDPFFSIDDFNRQTEEAEAGRLSGGRLGGEEDGQDEDDLGDLGAMMLQAGNEDTTVMYRDFFDAPRGSSRPQKGNGKEQGKPKGKGKGRRKGVTFEDSAGDEEHSAASEEDDDEGRGVMSRLKGDLFGDENEEEMDEQTLSTHERRQLALAKQIAELEQEAIGPKDWTLLGEASSRARPENSLLEEHLDFEQIGKVVPVVTEETVKSLEDIIKARIIDNNFNSTVRVRAYEPIPFLPSRFFDLQDTQSTKSLAQIYEEDFQAAASGSKVPDARDLKLSKEHEEIERLWGEICYKLDALSSLNFVPKQPKAQITTISNLPSATMESALPSTSAASTMLAPEELFAPPTSSSLVARTELTPEEKQKARTKTRKAKQSERKSLAMMAELYGKKSKGGAKAEKERALRGLVKTGKGVTIVGKGDKEKGKAIKRTAEGERADGKRLKL